MQSQTLTVGLRKKCVPVTGTEATWNGNVCIDAIHVSLPWLQKIKVQKGWMEEEWREQGCTTTTKHKMVEFSPHPSWCLCVWWWVCIWSYNSERDTYHKNAGAIIASKHIIKKVDLVGYWIKFLCSLVFFPFSVLAMHFEFSSERIYIGCLFINKEIL